MSQPIEYTRGEKAAIIALGVVGFFGINAVFAWAFLYDPQAMWDALRNPVSAVFIAEAFLVMGFLAYFLRRWGVARLGWGWFVVLSLLGSMAFAIPVVLLWPRREKTDPPARSE
ncbi:MAG: hypothetical protein MUF18_10535 [Fimbriiglobus sp.]|nr:hypothetical protein [Fimbriiglobus sp.]